MDVNRTNRRAVGWVLVVFVLGVALGALATYGIGVRVWGARPEIQSHRDKRARMVERFTHELNLTPTQQKQLEAILTEMQGKYEEIRKQTAPQTEQVRQEGREQIRAILTSEQKPKFEEFLNRLDEERKKRNAR